MLAFLALVVGCSSSASDSLSLVAAFPVDRRCSAAAADKSAEDAEGKRAATRD